MSGYPTAERIVIGKLDLIENEYGAVHLAALPGAYANETMHDSYGRRINYMRISLTDACNLRCVYCMPEQMKFRPRHELMSDEEILFLVRGASLGVNKIRLTGGEPSIRPGVVDWVAAIAQTPGVTDLAMTTNGVLLDKLARPLAAAGLKRVNISIDTLNPEKFNKITRWGAIDDVWRSILAAEEAGLRPVKLNSVVVRNFNDTADMIDLARLTLENEWEVRFIEMMPFGEISDFQQSNVVTFQEMRARIEAVFGPLEEASYDYVDPSRPFRIPGALGTLGFISSVTEPFCQGCGRVRLTADGKLRLCLLRDNEVDLLTPLRAGADFEEMRELMRAGAYHKPWGHGLAQGVFADNRSMNQLGG
ncbi:MAG: GTP 3',8-cyclase MoaA [Anaerolineales bacterium]|nr:GTP 3',8-cyclase MoaA [Anaerolineales bacterium]